MKVRHEALRSRWSSTLTLSSDDAIGSRPAAPDILVWGSVPMGVGGGFASGRCDHVDIRVISHVASHTSSDLQYLRLAVRAVLEAMAVRIVRREPCRIPGAEDLLTIIGYEHDFAGNDIDELVFASVPMTLARPCTRRQPA